MKDYARSRAWCEWTDFDTWRGRALRALDDPLAPATPPFHLLSLPGVTAAQQRQCAERWMLARLRDSAPSRALLAIEFASHPAADRPHQPIRVGYLSSDFHQHATSLLMVEMLEAHDRDDFTLPAYSSGADDGLGMRQRLCARFDSFTDIRAMDDMQAARAIHADGIDILVDLKGFTAGSRTELLTYRPAPVQVSFLGYPGTVGGDFCDYLISDSFVIPAGASADYSESMARLPDSYQPHGRQARPGVGPSRSTVGLPELITHSLEDYADLALSLAGDPARLAGLRRRLRAQRVTAPLFDVRRYSRSLEALYRSMWRRQRKGLARAAMGAAS